MRAGLFGARGFVSLAFALAAPVVATLGAQQAANSSSPSSTLKLGHARACALIAPARAGLPVSEYATRLVKKAVVGTGAAEKAQVHAMVQRLLPGVEISGPDAADALAVAITHAHHLASARRIG